MADSTSRIDLWRLMERVSLSEAAHLAVGHNPSEGFPDDAIWADIKTIEKALVDCVKASPATLGADVVWVDGELMGGDSVTDVEPDRTTVDLKKMCAWFKSRGVPSVFCIPEVPVLDDNFLNPDHTYFAPELAFAFHAWRNVVKGNPPKRGAKDRLATWMHANQGCWAGEGSIAAGTIERISTVANWNKGGKGSSSTTTSED